MKTVNVVIQARMGSSRLPGKMLLELYGMPVIAHALTRLTDHQSKGSAIGKIILATSTEGKDDPLAQYVKDHWPNVALIRGSENNVLERFVTAKNNFPSKYIARVTGDCPMLNAQIIDQMVDFAEANQSDIINYPPGHEYIDKGIEVVRADLFEGLSEASDLNDVDKEHVTAYFYRQPKKYKVSYLPSAPEMRRGDIRITIDTEEDLNFVEEVCRQMRVSPGKMDLLELIQYLDQNPQLLTINQMAGKKSTLHEKARVIFRCDGSREIGLGHVVGCLRLAKKLANLGFGSAFIVKSNAQVVALLKREGMAVETISDQFSPEEDITHLVKRLKEQNASAVIFNYNKASLLAQQDLFHKVKEAGGKLIFMDNPIPPSCYLADLTINALPHPHYEGYETAGREMILDGLEYFHLDPVFEALKSGSQKRYNQNVKRILISMGGADEFNVTAKVIKALAAIGFSGYVDVVLGIANQNLEQVEDSLKSSMLSGEVVQAVNDLPQRMLQADIGISALGLTTYEMSSMGLPVVLIATNELNGEVAQLYIRSSGAAIYLGLHNHLNVEAIAVGIKKMMKEEGFRKDLGINGGNIGDKNKEAIARLESTLLN